MMTNDCEHCLYRFGCKVRPILTENSVCGNEFHVPEEYDENVRQQGRADAIKDSIEMIGNNFDMQDLYLPIHIMEKLQELKEQRGE